MKMNTENSWNDTDRERERERERDKVTGRKIFSRTHLSTINPIHTDLGDEGFR
jgi:hypothetical protein